MIYCLERQGFKNHIHLTHPCSFPDISRARNCIREHFFPLNARVSIGHTQMPPAWATVASRWDTAYIVKGFRTTLRKYYFVQDYEPSFYPSSSTAIFAENTYRFNFYGLTAGRWLSDLLNTKYGMAATSFDFAVDHDIYKPMTDRSLSTKRVLFYSRSVTDRRGFELGLMALQKLVERLPEVEVLMVGWNEKKIRLGSQFKYLGVLSPEHLSYWLNRCDVALILSLTNLSLLPLEAMACGCVVVSNRGDNVNWLIDDNIAMTANPDIESLRDALIQVLSDNRLRKSISKEGIEFVRHKTWKSAYASVIGTILQHHQIDVVKDGWRNTN
jgi:glycosyltransferase involved in cell wall biosynthesis